MSHVFHEGLPGFSPEQILHDGCPECEERGQNIELALNHMDAATFQRAWERAQTKQRDGLPDCSVAEARLLDVLGAVRSSLERSYPGAATFFIHPLID